MAGSTHASNVIALLRCSEAESGIVTRELDPLKLNAPPYLPATQVAFAIVPLLPFPDESCRTVPAPSLNAYAATRLPVAARPLAMTPVVATSPLAAAANAMTLAMRDDILDPSFERAHAAARCLHTAMQQPCDAVLWLKVRSVAGRKEQEPRRRVPNCCCVFSPYRPRRQTRSVVLGGDDSRVGAAWKAPSSCSREPPAARQRRSANVSPSRLASFVSSDTHCDCQLHCLIGIGNQTRPNITQAGARNRLTYLGQQRAPLRVGPTRDAPRLPSARSYFPSYGPPAKIEWSRAVANSSHARRKCGGAVERSLAWLPY